MHTKEFATMEALNQWVATHNITVHGIKPADGKFVLTFKENCCG